VHSDGDVESLVKFHSPSAGPTAGVMPRILSAGYWWEGRDNVIVTESTSSHTNYLTARRACARRP